MRPPFPSPFGFVPWQTGICASALLLLGCTDEAPASSAAQVMTEGAPSAMGLDIETLPLPDTDEALAAQLDTVSAALAPHMEASEYRFTGKLGPGETRSHGFVLRYGRCYQLVAVGADSLTDLDLALFDGDAVERLRDLEQSRVARIGKRPELCPNRSGAYRVDVRAYRGSGRYAMRVLQTKPQI